MIWSLKELTHHIFLLSCARSILQKNNASESGRQFLDFSSYILQEKGCMYLKFFFRNSDNNNNIRNTFNA